MRWDTQAPTATDEAALPGLTRIAGLVRSVEAPEFAGVTFHEVLAKSALNRVPDSSAMPFRWTVNPWRGCTHACFYCYARGSHAWLDLGVGTDFDTRIVVKTNVGEVLRRELARPSWRREAVALGTNTDPYQRAEGRYRLMPAIIEALADSGTPFSILTKGTLMRRDLALLQAAGGQVSVGLGVSLAILDRELHESLEPGTPSPRARLDLVREITDRGLTCGVFVAPVLPMLTDGVDHLDRLLAELATAGATGVTVLPLHLRKGAREWYFSWLRINRPDLVAGYERLYARGAYAPDSYQRMLRERVRPLLAGHGFARAPTRRVDSRSDQGDYPSGSMPPDAVGADGVCDSAGSPTLF